MSREHARTIWNAAVDAVRPAHLLRDAVGSLDGRRIVVMGAGKAGAAMSVALEEALADRLDKVFGWVNVPAGTERATRRIHLHASRAPASNHPTEAGVVGSQKILRLARDAGPDDLGICLWSGGGSALLPAPVDSISLADKQAVTKLLHACGATIDEMNAVRKHLSAIKGGRLAEAFAGKLLVSFIISDVVGDPLDVIASGPTAADPTTFDDVWSVLDKYHLHAQLPREVRHFLERGLAGEVSDTPKRLPPHVSNRIIGNNALALAAAEQMARSLGYHVVNLGSFIEGETRELAIAMAGIVRGVLRDARPAAAPLCLLSGGETTVTLSDPHGKGGRNQEFVLAMLDKLGRGGMNEVVVLSGGTDGEDGPTDAAGAIANASTLERAAALQLDAQDALRRHDAYPFFQASGDLLVTGPTGSNVMDVRVILVASRAASAAG